MSGEWGGVLLRAGEQLGPRGLLEAEQHVARLDLGAPAVRAFHLKGGRCLRQHRADPELAVFLVQNVHARACNPANASRRGMCSAKLCRVWSPPSRMTVLAPSYLRAASRQSSTSSPVSSSSR